MARVFLRSMLATLTAVTLVDVANAQDKTLTEVQSSNIRLPMETDSPVFEFDSLGGFRVATPPSFVPTPALRVYADGRVVTGTSSPMIVGSEGTITKTELNQFLHLIVNKERFYELSSSGIKDKMTSATVRMMMDGATSKFTVDLPKGTHSVEIYALTLAARQFPQVSEIQQLVAIEKRCRQLIARINLGDPEQTKQLLRAVNQKLHAAYPDVPGFEESDFLFATNFKDGRFQATLSKSVVKTESRPASVVSARVVKNDPQSELQITISCASFD